MTSLRFAKNFVRRTPRSDGLRSMMACRRRRRRRRCIRRRHHRRVVAEELQALNFQTTEASDRDTPPPFEAAPELRAAKAVTNTTGPIAAVDGRRISSRPRPSQSLSSDPGGGAAMER
jgi:hypothetical protein